MNYLCKEKKKYGKQKKKIMIAPYLTVANFSGMQLYFYGFINVYVRILTLQPCSLKAFTPPLPVSLLASIVSLVICEFRN